MIERPILFSASMVEAILADTKTQTRRVIRPQPDEDGLAHIVMPEPEPFWRDAGSGIYRPPGMPGDRLWVKETWGVLAAYDQLAPRDVPDDTRINYAADGFALPGRARPSIFMRRWMSRLTLEITDVRVQRLQDISEDDARAEGVPPVVFMASGGFREESYAPAFEILWNQINGERAPWSANPWVWCLTFRRVEA